MDQVPQSATRSRFTFIDALVIAFVSVVAFTVIIMWLANATNIDGPVMQCKNNMKQVGTGIKVYESMEGCLPYIEQRKFTWPGGPELVVNVSLFYQLLSCIDAGDVANLPCYYAPARAQSAAWTKISAFQCPSDPSAGTSATSKQGPGTSTDCPIAMSNYVLNYSIFRGSKDNKLASKDVMEMESSTIIMGERLQFCGMDSNGNPNPQVWWAEPLRSTFWVAGIDNMDSGKPNETAPPGMGIQTRASPKTCQLSPQPGHSMPAGTYFQSSHPDCVYVLLGDMRVTKFPSGYDARSLNYWCLGIGRSQWRDSLKP